MRVIIMGGCAVFMVIHVAVGCMVVEVLGMVGGGRFGDINVLWYAVGGMREG